jgi:hypothetical protein
MVGLYNQSRGDRDPVCYQSAARGCPVGDGAGIWQRALGCGCEVGSSIGYAAKAGWDPCTGLGSPDGIKLVSILGGSQLGSGMPTGPGSNPS